LISSASAVQRQAARGGCDRGARADATSMGTTQAAGADDPDPPADRAIGHSVPASACAFGARS